MDLTKWLIKLPTKNRFNTLVLRSDLYDYSDACTVGIISVRDTNDDNRIKKILRL